MTEYLVIMRHEYDGVWVYVTADSAEEARLKAEAGEWHDEELHGAELINWRVSKVEENT